MMSDEQKLLQEALANLSPAEREQALEILKQYAASGNSELAEDLKWADFDEKPVNIDTFLHDKKYLGNGLYDAEGRFTVYPYWEEKLKEIFPDEISTAYNNVVLTGSIGIGKSFFAVICILYMLYRLLCLKDPYTYYGMQKIDKLTISFMNITLENAKGVALDKMNQLILSSDWFMAHGEMNGTTNLIYRPEKHIEFVMASSNNQIVGRALFCLDGSTEICTTNGIRKLEDLVDKDIRVVSIDNEGKKCLSDLCTVKPTIKTNEEYQLELADGFIIKCTPNHRFKLIDGTYKEAQYLTEKDKLMATHGHYFEYIDSIKIHAIKKIILPEQKQYYDVINATPYNNFLIKTNNSNVVSHNCNFSDEVNFAVFNNPEKQKERMMKIITQVDARMKSRFMRTKPDGSSYLPTLNIIASSKDTEQSFLDAYIDGKRKTESKNTLIVDEPQWVVDSRKDSPIKFYVAVGSRILPNELLPVDATQEMVEEYQKKGYQMWKVPIGYLDTFQQNLDEAICSIIGISTASSLKYISGERWFAIKTDEYKNPFLRDVIKVGNHADDHLQYSNFFDLERVSIEDLGKPLFMHLDLSLSGDKTGIAGVWIDGKVPTIIPENSDDDDIDYSNDLRYKVAFSTSIEAPKGTQVSFEKTRNFIRWLRDKGFNICLVSSDTFNSANILQDLKADGFKTEILSVDRVDNRTKIQQQYAYFRSAINERRMKVYKDCELLTDEVLQLERLSNGHIEHEAAGTKGSKDQCDAVCGSLWGASRYAEQYAYEYGDTLLNDLMVNDIVNNPEAKKQQYIKDFEQDLQSIWSEIDATEQKKCTEQQEDMQSYMDIANGIIVL